MSAARTEHDPLCLLYPSSHRVGDSMCSCGLIVRVRAESATRIQVLERVANHQLGAVARVTERLYEILREFESGAPELLEDVVAKTERLTREQVAADIEAHAEERWTDDFYANECARIARGLPEPERS